MLWWILVAPVAAQVVVSLRRDRIDLSLAMEGSMRLRAVLPRMRHIIYSREWSPRDLLRLHAWVEPRISDHLTIAGALAKETEDLVLFVETDVLFIRGFPERLKKPTFFPATKDPELTRIANPDAAKRAAMVLGHDVGSVYDASVFVVRPRLLKDIDDEALPFVLPHLDDAPPDFFPPDIAYTRVSTNELFASKAITQLDTAGIFFWRSCAGQGIR